MQVRLAKKKCLTSSKRPPSKYPIQYFMLLLKCAFPFFKKIRYLINPSVSSSLNSVHRRLLNIEKEIAECFERIAHEIDLPDKKKLKCEKTGMQGMFLFI